MGKFVLMVVIVTLSLYLGISTLAFNIRNPLSNKTVVLTHFVDVVTWQRVEYFQIDKSKH